MLYYDMLPGTYYTCYDIVCCVILYQVVLQDQELEHRPRQEAARRAEGGTILNTSLL